MSTTNQAAEPSRSNQNFAAIFQSALSEYDTVTGKPLRDHPFATQLDRCDSPEAVLNVLRTQARALSASRKRDERLMAWLDPTIHILFTFSGTLGEGIGLVSCPFCSVWSSPDTWLSAILSCENDLHWDRRASCGRSISQLSCRAFG
jgi:hypothetical protein